jgi:hypothetical protein
MGLQGLQEHFQGEPQEQARGQVQGLAPRVGEETLQDSGEVDRQELEQGVQVWVQVWVVQVWVQVLAQMEQAGVDSQRG